MIKGHKYSKNLRKFCGYQNYLYLCTRLAESKLRGATAGKEKKADAENIPIDLNQVMLA